MCVCVRPHTAQVRLGDVEVIPTFHEAATLVVVMPPHTPGPLIIKVTNDGVHYCESKVRTHTHTQHTDIHTAHCNTAPGHSTRLAFAHTLTQVMFVYH